MNIIADRRIDCTRDAPVPITQISHSFPTVITQAR
jgi:hypothetical protein